MRLVRLAGCVWLALILAEVASPASALALDRRPNVLILLADDLGYGDVGVNNPTSGKIRTPRIDALAREGLRFTDAHSSSGVCSPTRYALLTGRYHWRTRLQRGIVGVWEPPLIAANRLTIAGLAKGKGYRTDAVGKWHLGWDWPIPPAQRAMFGGAVPRPSPPVDRPPTAEERDAWKAAFSKPIPGGPTTRGFETYFGTDVPNWPPYLFIENDRTVGTPTTWLPASKFARNQASLTGPALDGWELDAILPALADRVCERIDAHAKARETFLLYVPLTAPHTPLAVAAGWKGKSELKHPYADFVMQTDAVVGRILDRLASAGVADDTLVVFTSDNGCAPYIGAKDLEAKGHRPSGPLRGYKSDAWEGGHRVPLIVRWPGVVRPGSTTGQTVGSVDLMATLAEILDVSLPPNAGEDSVSFLPLLKGEDRPVRTSLVSQSSSGTFAVRSGPWKLILGPGSGPPDGTPPHLYHLDSDLGETKDLAPEKPGEVARLKGILQDLVRNGRSTPGPEQANDAPIRMIKPAVKPASPPLATTDRVYKTASGEPLRLHVFQPGDVQPGDRRTAVVFFFGGGWSAWNPTQFDAFARHFARLGCVAICADYRVASKHKTTPIEAVRDAKSAVRYVREHARELGIDPDRIVVSGGSAGGHLAACTTLVPGYLEEPGGRDALASANALVLFNPVLDLDRLAKNRGKELLDISPQQRIRKGLPPTQIFHGKADTTVPFAQVVAFEAAMKAAGNVCEVEAFPGRGHGFFNSPEFRKGAGSADYDACVSKMTSFLERQGFLPARAVKP